MTAQGTFPDVAGSLAFDNDIRYNVATGGET